MKSKKQRTSLGSYIGTRTFWVGSVPLGLAFLLTLVFLQGIQFDTAIQQQTYLAENLAEETAVRLNEFGSVISTAGNHIRSGLIRPDQDPQSVSTYFSGILGSNTDMLALWLLDGLSGKVLNRDPIQNDVLGFDISRSESFLLANHDEPRWSRITQNPFFTGPVLSLSFRVDGYVLVAWFEPQVLVKLVQTRQFANNQYSFALDPQGLVVAHPDQTMVQRRISMRNNPLVIQALENRAVNGVHEGILYNLQPVLKHQWVIGVAQPEAELQKNISIISGLGFSAFLGSVGVLLFTSRRITRMVNRSFDSLARGSIELSQGNYSANLETQPFSELDDLRNAFIRMRNAVKDREYNFRKIVTYSDIVFFVLDKNGVFTLSEGKALEKLGLKPGQVVGQSALEIYKDDEAIFESLNRCYQGETQQNLTRLNDLYFETYFTPVLDDEGQVSGIVGLAINITEREKLNQKIQKMNNELEKQVGIRTSELTRANGELEELNTELQLTLKNLEEAQHHMVEAEKLSALGHFTAGIAHELNTPLGAILSSSELVQNFLDDHFVSFLKNLEGLNTQQRETFYTLLNHGLPKCLEMETTDRDYQKNKDLQKKLSDAGIVRSRQVADMLIEYNLVSSLDQILPLISGKDGMDELVRVAEILSLRQAAGLTFTAGKKAASVTNALRSYIAPQAREEGVPVDIESDIDTILTIMRNKLKRGIEIRRDYQGIWTVGSSEDLSQVWMNLISNAAQAMEYRGILTIKTEKAGNQVKIHFIDTGRGVPTDLKDDIFQPFFTTKARGEGIGLGLDICKKIIFKNFGTIEFESEPGNTRFTVTLPGNTGSGEAL